MLVDTCVWLDVAKDRSQLPLLDLMDEMIRLDLLRLLVPTTVLEEFQRNRDRVAQESRKSLSAHFRLVKDAVTKVGGEQKKLQDVMSHLDDVTHKIPLIGSATDDTLQRIEDLLKRGVLITPSTTAMLEAAKRAVAKKAPFHHNKNSMADAVIIETYAEAVKARRARGSRFIFVTHNKSDFSAEQGDQRLPHPDLASLFSPLKSLFFINMTTALRRIDPNRRLDYMLELSWNEEPRGRSEISEAGHLLWNQVWYNRHWNRRSGVEDGTIKIVSVETAQDRKSPQERTVQGNVWESALLAARKVEEEFGLENLGPWTDFEWGMINGKLSALNWVMGDEWDMLDT
ncbi:PIN domain-containing protein [Granulicella arctica]|uniref:PIN domain-containing protein n=1 Tax=Granulicella arctica TaxID=940613 RepID=UPI0021E0CC7F|nr:PIN domain-containing protein [Granulicella arctica]